MTDKFDEMAAKLVLEATGLPGGNGPYPKGGAKAIALALRTTDATAREEEQEACAQAAYLAKLPDNFHWGSDAMEQFDFGKERAALAIRARSQEKP